MQKIYFYNQVPSNFYAGGEDESLIAPLCNVSKNYVSTSFESQQCRVEKICSLLKKSVNCFYQI